MAWYLLKLPFVRTNTSYVKVDTKPYATRTALVKNRRTYQNLRDNTNEIKSVKIRDEFDNFRKFKQSQIETIENLLDGSYLCDNLTRFGIRPPEYLSINKVMDYMKWFTFTSCSGALETLNSDLQLSSIQ